MLGKISQVSKFTLAKMATQALARAVFLDVRPAPPIKACDLAAVDMMVAEVENLQEYRLNGGVWQRAAAPRCTRAASQARDSCARSSAC